MSRIKHVALMLLISAALLWQNVENKSFFGIGMRVYGDQLLLKDVQQSRPAGIGEQPTIQFSYAIREPITYFEIMSEDSIYAEVDFGYHDSLVTGSVTTINRSPADQVENTNSTSTTSVDLKPKTQSFEILLKIYGFNDTMLNVSPAYVLNRDQQFEGVLEPFDEPLDSVEEDIDSFGPLVLEKRNSQLATDEGDSEVEDELEEVAAGIEVDGAHELWPHASDDIDISDNDFEHHDKIIEIGNRQTGDYLIYETYHTSPDSSQEPTNHTLTFYYIDSNYITYVKFIVYDHFASKSSTAKDYVAPLAEYTHYSPNTLRAVITEFNTTYVFVQMFMYGYKPEDKPSHYEPFLPPPHWHRASMTTEQPQLTAMERLKRLFEAERKSQVVQVIDDNDNDDERIGDNDFAVSPNDTKFVQVTLIKTESAAATNSAQANTFGLCASAAGLITAALNLYL